MGDPSAFLLPDLVLEEIFVRLPPRDFHQCRCLSRSWAAALSSDDLMDRHLCVRGKIRLHYDDIMRSLVLGGAVHCRAETKLESESDGDTTSEEKENGEGDCKTDDENEKIVEIPEEKDETIHDDDDDDDDDVDGDDDDEEEDDSKEEHDWREEYRLRGYVEVDEDYYIRRAEFQAWAEEAWERAKKKYGVTTTESDDSGDDSGDAGAELLKACTIPFGALHPRIRQPLLEEDPSLDHLGDQGGTEEHINMRRIHGREKTEEEVDQEIIAFLRRLRDMDPQPTFLREFDTYRWPPVYQQGQEEMAAFEEEVGQQDYLDYSDDGEFDEESAAAVL